MPAPRPSRSLLPRRASVLVVAILLAGCARGTARLRLTSPAPADSTARRALAAEQGATPAGRGTLGVTPFRVPGAASRLGPLSYALADLLATDLARSAQLVLVERARLGEVLRELDLAGSGRVDSATAPRAGRLMQARRLVLGGLDSLPGGEVRLAVRIADVERGLLEEAIDARAPLTDVLAAEKALAFRLFEVLGVTLTPAERALVAARPTTSSDALFAYGRGVSAELAGDLPGAVAAFDRARAVDPGFRAAVERGAQARAAMRGTATAALLPGIRGVEAPVVNVVDRLNRPLDHITTRTRPLGGVGDPAFPSTIGTVVITVRRP